MAWVEIFLASGTFLLPRHPGGWAASIHKTSAALREYETFLSPPPQPNFSDAPAKSVEFTETDFGRKQWPLLLLSNLSVNLLTLLPTVFHLFTN